MKIVDCTDPVIKWYEKVTKSSDNLRDYEVKLSQEEIGILKQAYEICSKAEVLQTKRNELMGIDDECYNNDFAWVTIHLHTILKDNGVKDE